MNKINIYLFNLTSKYIFFNLLIVSIFFIFLNLIELTRIIENNDKNLINFTYLSLLKFPSILNEIIPFVIIIATSFLLRNLINNNELISMRNIGYSIFDIFYPIGLSVFFIGIIFLTIVNPIASSLEIKFEEEINKKEQNLYSIKFNNNEMWIKNQIDNNQTNFINIKNIDLKEMKVENVKILVIKNNKSNFIQAKNGVFTNDKLILNEVDYLDINDENFNKFDNFELKTNFNKENILNSIENYRLIPFYNYIAHSNTLKKFNLYSPEIGLFYLSEILKPLFIVMLSFVILGFSGKFKRNENFFKILFISFLIGFLIFFLKEIINKFTISLSINFYFSYLVIFFVPFSIGLYQIIKIEND